MACDVTNKSADQSVSSNYKTKWMKESVAGDENLPRKSILKMPILKPRLDVDRVANQTVIVDGADRPRLDNNKSFGRLKKFSVVTKSIKDQRVTFGAA